MSCNNNNNKKRSCMMSWMPNPIEILLTRSKQPSWPHLATRTKLDNGIFCLNVRLVFAVVSRAGSFCMVDQDVVNLTSLMVCVSSIET